MINTNNIIGSYAILTALSSNIFSDFVVFCDSVRRIGDYPIYAVSLELTDEQKSFLITKYDIKIIELTSEQLTHYQTFDKNWKQWYKPAYFQFVEHIDYVLWIDADTVVLKDLAPLFIKASEQFFVMQDYFAPKTCINDDKLYDEFKLSISNKDIALNSGVIGCSPKRDSQVIGLWLEKVKILHDRTELRPYVKLYDQGCLLWALHELNMIDNILDIKKWNYPAKRNIYEYCLPNVNQLNGDHIWPTKEGPQVGGDTIQCITMDNQNAVIAHFAGLPKLSQLCVLNNKSTIAYFRHKRGPRNIGRVFVVGLERCGTHTIAEVLRRSCNVECCVRHEHLPTLSHEAMLKYSGQYYKTPDFIRRLEFYSRLDCGLVAEANHRLSYFIDDIQTCLNGQCKFILMLRNPIELIRSRLYNFSIWPQFIHRFPLCYQLDIAKLRTVFSDGSPWQNVFRICPDNFDVDPIDMHLWEISYTLRLALSQLKSLPKSSWEVFWLEYINQSATRLVQFVGNSTLSLGVANEIMKVKYGGKLCYHSPETVKWIDDAVNRNAIHIYKTISEVLKEFDMHIPFNGI